MTVFSPCTRKWLGYQMSCFVVQRKLLSRMIMTISSSFLCLCFQAMSAHFNLCWPRVPCIITERGCVWGLMWLETVHKVMGKLHVQNLDLMTHPSLADNSDSLYELVVKLIYISLMRTQLITDDEYHLPTYLSGARRPFGGGAQTHQL